MKLSALEWEALCYECYQCCQQLVLHPVPGDEGHLLSREEILGVERSVERHLPGHWQKPGLQLTLQKLSKVPLLQVRLGTA